MKALSLLFLVPELAVIFKQQKGVDTDEQYLG